MRDQQVAFAARLDALGDDLQAERVGQPTMPSTSAYCCAEDGDGVDEGLVDLEDVDRQWRR